MPPTCYGTCAALASYLADVAGGFNGTLSELLDRLERYRPHGENWPRSAKGLGVAPRHPNRIEGAPIECSTGPFHCDTPSDRTTSRR